MEESVGLRSPYGLTLAGTLLRPDGVERPPVTVFAHGFGSGKASPRNRAVAEALVDAGIAALLIDFSGHGESEGDPGAATLDDQEGELAVALDFVEARPDLGEIGVAGSSSGGAVAIAVAARDPRVRALVLRAPSAAASFDQASALRAPTLLVQGGADPLGERNRRLAGALGGEHRMCEVSGAGHLFDEPGAFAVVVRETVRWLRRWLLGARDDAGGAVRPGASAVEEPGPSHFADRAEAGRALAKRLKRYGGAETLVLGLPRGGAAVAEPIALELGADLDVFVSRKVRAPDQPELAIGAVAEGDTVLWNEDLVAALGLDEAATGAALDLARRELEDSLATVRAVLPRAPVEGREVIVTDDGVATGATLKAAIRALAKQSAARIVVAVPGGPAETLREIGSMPGVDELVALAVPEAFWAVGQLYDAFEPVSTQEVRDILRLARARRRAHHALTTGACGSDTDGARPRSGEHAEIQVDLSTRERELLTRVISRCLGDLRSEVRRTRQPAFHDELVAEAELLKSLLERLEAAAR